METSPRDAGVKPSEIIKAKFKASIERYKNESIDTQHVGALLNVVLHDIAALLDNLDERISYLEDAKVKKKR